jgi:hypothetical protein
VSYGRACVRRSGGAHHRAWWNGTVEGHGWGAMYWTDLGISKIQRVNLDGTGLRDLVATNRRFPRGIALDEAGGKI